MSMGSQMVCTATLGCLDGSRLPLPLQARKEQPLLQLVSTGAEGAVGSDCFFLHFR